jgi:hypothetical protein
LPIYGQKTAKYSDSFTFIVMRWCIIIFPINSLSYPMTHETKIIFQGYIKNSSSKCLGLNRPEDSIVTIRKYILPNQKRTNHFIPFPNDGRTFLLFHASALAIWVLRHIAQFAQTAWLTAITHCAIFRLFNMAAWETSVQRTGTFMEFGIRIGAFVLLWLRRL